MDIVLHTQQEEAKDRALGGKASGLLHLEAQGAQVPPFLVVAPEVFYRHLPKAEWDAFLAEQATVDPEKPQQTYPAAEKLCEAIMDGALDDAVTGALEAGLGKILPSTTLFGARCWAKTARSTHSRGSLRAFSSKKASMT